MSESVRLVVLSTYIERKNNTIVKILQLHLAK